MTDHEPPWRKRFERSLEELQTLGEQVSRRLEQGTDRARSEMTGVWRELQPKIGAAESRLRGATDDAVEQLEGMFGELSRSLRSLRDKL